MKTVYLLLFCSLFFLVGCGQSAGATEAVSLLIEGNDTLSFTPENASVPNSADIRLTFKNAGSLDHNIILTTKDANLLTLTQADALDGIQTEIIAGGESTSITFDAPAAGRYLYVCVVPGHAASGMVGELMVAP